MKRKNRLRVWREVIGTLENPKDRPNDFQRLVVSCLRRGMYIRDAQRIFGLSQPTMNRWLVEFDDVSGNPDQLYFMRRARQLGADDETIAEWFGFDRPDKVCMLLAKNDRV